MSMPNETARLVIRATSPDENPRERNDAFAALVVRYQDATFAWAYALLGDRAAAEDVSQDAFVAAWLNLSRLREPDAFGGWLRRIVQREAVRRAKASRRFVALEHAAELPGAEGLVGDVERRETLASLLATLTTPEHEATALFYIGGHSQREVANLLGVSVAAVKQRLHTARRRFKAKGAELMSELNNERPSRDGAFTDRLTRRLRLITPADYTRVLQMVEAMEPGMDEEHAEWLYNRQQLAASGLKTRSFVIEDEASGELLAFAAIEQDSSSTVHRQFGAVERSSDSNVYRLHVAAANEVLAVAGDDLYREVESAARALGAEALWLRETTARRDIIDLLRRHGFQDDHRATGWSIVVDRPSADVHGGAASGLVISTLAEERNRPAHLDDFYEFWQRPSAVPETRPSGPYEREEIDRQLHLPHIVPDSYFFARRADVIVGVMNLWHPHEATPSIAPVGFRVTEDAADTDVEQALIARAVAYASQHGYSELVTHAVGGPFEAPSVYAAMGFRPVMEMIVVSKELG